MINKTEQRERILFDQIAGKYARKDMMASSLIARKQLLVDAARPLLDGVNSLGVILDIGCGVGAPARYLDGCYDRYIGVDQSEKMIEAARVFHQGNTRVEFIAGNIKSLELPGDRVDLILSVGALHHMTDLDSVIKSLRRLSKPRGFILAIEPQSANPAVQLMRRVRGWLDKSYSSEQIFFSREQLADLFNRNGIRNVSFEYLGYVSVPMAEVVMRPQFVFTPLSRMAACADSWLAAHLPVPLKKFSFKIAVRGEF
jgi:ubiquinone/menaquinone biosynthesis C-methylase UbiE